MLLALISLHFQLNSPLIKEVGNHNLSLATQEKGEVLFNTSNKLSLYKSSQNHNAQLMLFKNNRQTTVVFSHKETTSVLILITLIKISFLVSLIFIAVVTYKAIKRQSKKQKAIPLLILLLMNQYLLPWYIWGEPYVNKTPQLPSQTFTFFLCSFALLWIITTINISRSSSRNKGLIAYASQSGTSALLAKSMSKNLAHTNQYDIACFSSIKAHQLTDYERILFLASTYGDGEPPEKALSFMNSLHQLEHSLNSVTYAVLAFGDKQYPHFCAFGHSLAESLNNKGAKALLPVTEIHRANDITIQSWWQTISNLLNWHSSELSNHSLKTQVLSNQCLNPLSPSRPAHHIRLKAKNVNFIPGDLIDITPKNNKTLIVERLSLLNWSSQTIVQFQHKSIDLLSALEHLEWQQETAKTPQNLIDQLPKITARTYSIASCKEQGHIDLIVRKVIKNDNTLGLCSNYLASLQVDQSIDLSVKIHQGFHPPSAVTPILMIAAGTGIAPFIGFLAQRTLTKNPAKAWLIMGERDPLQDNYFSAELTEFENIGCLDKRQHAWSKNKIGYKYVGEIMKDESENIRHWLLTLNAQIYICGNASTLGKSCDSALREIFGDTLFSKFKKQDQIKYDLY